MIEFDHVTRTYGPRTAVADLSLAIPRGELFALLGPNGAGKTTTFYMVVGLVRADAGTIHIDGRPVHNLPIRRWRMEWLPLWCQLQQQSA
jgi:lipopolysaccharide export system ATP-binding protein